MASPDQSLLQAIHQIAEALSSSELRSLFYLCESPGTDITMACAKEMLKSKVMCYESGYLFLAELLLQLRRLDILRRVCRTSRDEVERTLQYKQVLPRFRVLMAHISDEMANEDLSSMKFLISNTLPREKIEKAKNFLELVIELEKVDLVSPERVDFVEECLANIGRADLVKKVSTYKTNTAGATLAQHPPQQERCSAFRLPPTSYRFRHLQQTRREQLQHIGPESLPLSIHGGQTCQSPVDSYSFKSNPRGVCVIIDCVGNDGDMLEQTFTALHFNVTLYKCLSVDDTLSTLRQISRQRENLKGDGFVCCIISRSTADCLLGVDLYNAGVNLNSIRRLFTPDACPVMTGKPKLFFIQTYSVPKYQPSARMHHRDGDLETDGCYGQSSYECIPIDADVFWSHCWTDESQLQQRHHHSIYLKALADALLKGQKRKTKLVDIHTEVNGAIYEHNSRNPGTNYHLDLKLTLRKDLYLQ